MFHDFFIFCFPSSSKNAQRHGDFNHFPSQLPRAPGPPPLRAGPATGERSKRSWHPRQLRLGRREVWLRQEWANNSHSKKIKGMIIPISVVYISKTLLFLMMKLWIHEGKTHTSHIISFKFRSFLRGKYCTFEQVGGHLHAIFVDPAKQHNCHYFKRVTVHYSVKQPYP